MPPQMLGEQLDDPDGVEGGKAGSAQGLGLLPLRTCFGGSKALRQRQEISHWPASAGSLLQGFELHRGSSHAHGSCQPLCPEAPELGWVQGSVAGTYLHGVFDNGLWRRHWLNHLRQRRQLPPLPLDQPHHAQQRDLLLDRLADAFEAHVNLEPLLQP